MNQQKPIALIFKSDKPVQYKEQLLSCETQHIEQENLYFDWDDSKTLVRYVSQAEYDYVQKKKEEEVLRKKEEELTKGKKKDAKKP